jgi:F0F1-type ATP synthase delta subunit
MSTLSEDLAGIREHLESFAKSAELQLAERIPAIAAVAGKIESDPLVQAAISTVLPASYKAMVVDVIQKLEGLAAEEETKKQQAAQQAVADAQAAATAPPAEGETPVDPNVASAA